MSAAPARIAIGSVAEVPDAPGIWRQQVMVILMTFVPLWVVLWRRWQAGAWTRLAAAERNPAILGKVTKGHDGKAGVYGAVLVEGMVRVGDDIEVLN